jgi:hypothetical protein
MAITIYDWRLKNERANSNATGNVASDKRTGWATGGDIFLLTSFQFTHFCWFCKAGMWFTQRPKSGCLPLIQKVDSGQMMK